MLHRKISKRSEILQLLYLQQTPQQLMPSMIIHPVYCFYGTHVVRAFENIIGFFQRQRIFPPSIYTISQGANKLIKFFQSRVRRGNSNDDSITNLSLEHYSSQSDSLCLEDHVLDHNLSEKCEMENDGRQVEPTHSYHRRCLSSIVPEVTQRPTREEM